MPTASVFAENTSRTRKVPFPYTGDNRRNISTSFLRASQVLVSGRVLFRIGARRMPPTGRHTKIIFNLHPDVTRLHHDDQDNN
jgi:hypothetical protein